MNLNRLNPITSWMLSNVEFYYDAGTGEVDEVGMAEGAEAALGVGNSRETLRQAEQIAAAHVACLEHNRSARATVPPPAGYDEMAVAS